MKKLVQSNKGQGLVELAIVLPFLLILLLALFDFARFYHTYITLDHTGREAARVASIGGDDSEVITQISNSVDAALDFSTLVYDISPSSRTSGDNVTITLEYDFEFVTPILSSLASYTFEEKTVMRVE